MLHILQVIDVIEFQEKLFEIDNHHLPMADRLQLLFDALQPEDFEDEMRRMEKEIQELQDRIETLTEAIDEIHHITSQGL